MADPKPETLDDPLASADPAAYNVDLIARLEREALHRRTSVERFSDGIVRFAGSLKFVLFHLLVVAGWIIVNLGGIGGIAPFDPFPFGILTLIVSAEAIFLTMFVLISQNRMTKQAEKRNQLDLQISMLAEQELTTILRMQQQLCHHFGIDIGPTQQAADHYTKSTNVQRVAEELEQKLPRY